MSMSRRSRTVAVLATAAIVPVAAVGVGSAAAQSSSSTTTTQSGLPPRGGPGHGPDLAALATKLGVTQAQLKAAFDATRPTGTPPTGKPGKGDKGAGFAADIAKALGVSADKVQPILDANRPAKPTTQAGGGHEAGQLGARQRAEHGPGHRQGDRADGARQAAGLAQGRRQRP